MRDANRTSSHARMPRARKEGLEAQCLAGEILVYDLTRHRAHALSPTAALVWKHCDGTTTIEEMVEILRSNLGLPADTKLVRWVLARLAKSHLLEDGAETWPPAGTSRRDFVKKLKRVGLTASTILPFVTSIVSPTPGHAQTCVPFDGCQGMPNCTPCMGPGGVCGNNWVCCNGQCTAIGQARTQCGC